jgi:predicted lysophospholipase L1 biosynthesis ABC-type transport system permease subunit
MSGRRVVVLDVRAAEATGVPGVPGIGYLISPHTWRGWLMRFTDRLGQAQRIVIVIAFGTALGAVGGYLVSLGNAARIGWYAYAPLTQQIYPPRTGLAGWLQLIIWLALIGLWTLVSVRVLRPSQRETPHG